MNDTLITPRDLSTPKAREATRCPIFLLQTSQVGLTADYCATDWEFLDDGEMIYNGDVDALDGGEGKRLSGDALDDFLISRGMARRYWTTFDGGVWFTREEATAEANRRSYHYGIEGKNWRVYCVCANGELEKVLNLFSEYAK